MLKGSRTFLRTNRIYVAFCLILIGRDVLQSCTLFYNGSVGQFTLSL